MAFISVTRLHVGSGRFVLPFVWYSLRSARQAKRAPGNLGVALRKTPGLTFWTLTAWDSQASMRAFRSAPPHVFAMRKLPHWCDEASYAHWEHESQNLPPWDYATDRLRATGTLSPIQTWAAAGGCGFTGAPSMLKLSAHYDLKGVT